MRRCLVQACKGICSTGCAERWAHRIMILAREGFLPEHSGTKSALGVACRATILQLAGLESIVRDFNKQFITAVAAANSHRPQTVKFRTQLRNKPLLYRRLAITARKRPISCICIQSTLGSAARAPGWLVWLQTAADVVRCTVVEHGCHAHSRTSSMPA